MNLFTQDQKFDRSKCSSLQLTNRSLERAYYNEDKNEIQLELIFQPQITLEFQRIDNFNKLKILLDGILNS